MGRSNRARQVEDGLIVKVGFGKVWKQSLTELSGGQRSLVALSLILSLLRFKPAPIYILDEVDSALDLSHTQVRLFACTLAAAARHPSAVRLVDAPSFAHALPLLPLDRRTLAR